MISIVDLYKLYIMYIKFEQYYRRRYEVTIKWEKDRGRKDAWSDFL